MGPLLQIARSDRGAAKRPTVALAPVGRRAQRDREKAGDRAHSDLGAWPDAEPHDHDRKEYDLWRWSEIIEVGLECLAEEPVGAEDQTGGEPGHPADQQGARHLER